MSTLCKESFTPFKKNIEAITQYLLDSAYVVDADMMGYGCGNPANTGAAVIREDTIYTIQTSEVMLAYLNVLKLDTDKLDIDEASIKDALYEMTTDFGTYIYVEENGKSYFAYSNHPDDRNLEIVNTSAMMAGAIAKTIDTIPDYFTTNELSLIKSNLLKVIQTIESEEINILGNVQLKYCETDPDSTWNDYIHAAFVYEGLINLKNITEGGA